MLTRILPSECRYGEIVDVNLVRDQATGKPKGFAFLAYEDQLSIVLNMCQCRHSTRNVAKHTYYRAIKDMQGDTPGNNKFRLPYICIQICNMLVPV